jgi:hypothetical protein
MADAPTAAPATPAAAPEAPITETPAAAAPDANAAPIEGQPAADAPPAEPPAAAEPPPPPKVEPVVSKGLALLTKREAEARKRDDSIKAREAAVEAREARLKAAAEDPEAALNAIGLTYDQITDYYIRGKQVTPEMKAQAEAKKTRDALEKLEADAARRESERVQGAVSAYKTEISTFVAGDNKERFEYINALSQQELVYEVIDRHLSQTGELLGGDPKKAIELAAEKVEEYLAQEYAERLLTTKKFQNKIQPSREERPTANPAQKQPARTLSHSQAASVPPRAPVKYTGNPDEMIEQLIASGVKLYKPD